MGVYPDLAGTTAVVTGGSRGVGAATAQAFAANGAAVAVVGRDDAALAGAVQTISSHGGRAIGVSADCTNDAALAVAGHRVREEFGGADILVAFAGGGGAPRRQCLTTCVNG